MGTLRQLERYGAFFFFFASGVEWRSSPGVVLRITVAHASQQDVVHKHLNGHKSYSS